MMNNQGNELVGLTKEQEKRVSDITGKNPETMTKKKIQDIHNKTSLFPPIVAVGEIIKYNSYNFEITKIDKKVVITRITPIPECRAFLAGKQFSSLGVIWKIIIPLDGSDEDINLKPLGWTGKMQKKLRNIKK